jgi:hypothetical protein
MQARMQLARFLLALGASLAAKSVLSAQAPTAPQPPQTEIGPIAIVPLDTKNPDKAATVTGALEVSQGKAVIVASGAITSGAETTEVILPHRGVLRVCSSTTVKLAADASVPISEVPGLLMAMARGGLRHDSSVRMRADGAVVPGPTPAGCRGAALPAGADIRGCTRQRE